MASGQFDVPKYAGLGQPAKPASPGIGGSPPGGIPAGGMSVPAQESLTVNRYSDPMQAKTPPNQPDIAGGPVDRDQLNYQQTGMPEYMPGGMRTEQLASVQMAGMSEAQMDTPQAMSPPVKDKPDEKKQWDWRYGGGRERAAVPESAKRPVDPADTYAEPTTLQQPSIGTPGGQVGEPVGGLNPPASVRDSQWQYPSAPNYLEDPANFPGPNNNVAAPPPREGGAGPTYQAPGVPQPTDPGIAVSTATPVPDINKPPGAMTNEHTDVLKRNMEEVAGSQNPVDTSMRNVLSQVLEQGADIDTESLVPRLKTERERLASFREVAQRRLLSDLARRGFQLGGSQEAAVLAELEQQITTATAQSFREIVNDERTRADARLTQSMQIAAQQQALAQQLGLSREELAVSTRLGYGQEQLGYSQLAQAGEALGVEARLGYGRERLGQEQLAVAQQQALAQQQLGRGELALGQEQLAAQERQSAAQQQLGYETLSVQERAALGEEALGYAGLDVQQQAARAQAEASRQQLADQRAYQQAQIGIGQYGAETAQYEAETERVRLENDTVLRDLEMSQGFDQFLLQMGFDKAALEASLTMAEEGQTQQLLGMLNNYLATIAQGRVD